MLRKLVVAMSLLVIASVSYAEDRLGILQVEAPVMEEITLGTPAGDGHTYKVLPTKEGVVSFEAVINLDASGTLEPNWLGDIMGFYQAPAARSARLVLPVVPEPIELGGGEIQTLERDETNPDQGPWFKDEINTNHQLPEGERFTIEIEGEKDFTVMAIGVNTMNYAATDPILLDSPDLAKNESGQFQFSTGRVEVRVYFQEYVPSGTRFLNVVAFKDVVVNVDTDRDGVQDVVDLCESTLSGSVVDASGCSVQQHCPCEADWRGADWKNHGQMVACTSSVAEIFVSEGLLTDDGKDGVVGEAARSSCGKPSKGKK